MTALKKFSRLEASGLWRATPEDQRREVIVSIGDATLMISDIQDRAITHWSLAAVERANPGVRPAIYFPDGDPGETLELAEAEKEMIEAIEKLRRAVAKARPHPGRLRWLGIALSLALVIALGVFWLPGAVIGHATSVVPQAKRAEIGDALLTRIERVTGPSCASAGGQRSLSLLRARLGVGPLHVVPSANVMSLHLPGGDVLIDASLVEDYEEPDVVAGFVLAETLLARQTDPLADMLRATGVWSAFTLLTTGSVKPETLDFYAQRLLRQTVASPDPQDLLPLFEKAGMRSTPYAYARDVTGETVLALIEADPMAGKSPAPLLKDADWLRLQAICGG